MFLSVFDLFKVGIGPSSSHTVGPMIAARRFLISLKNAGLFSEIDKIHIDVYGSLALTGIGHGTDVAIILGLMGHAPGSIDPDIIDGATAQVRSSGTINLLQEKTISFDPVSDMPFLMAGLLPHHTNGMGFQAFDGKGALLSRDNYYSIGGGFVLSEAEMGKNQPDAAQAPVPYPFGSGDELLDLCEQNDLSIADLMRANELALISAADLQSGMDTIWQAMEGCIDRGFQARGILPGGLEVERRAAQHYEDLRSSQERQLCDPTVILDWINLWALAVNEENAAGGRVVTAPTNGAAGIIPAVLRYFDRFYNRAGRDGIYNFLLTAAAIGSLYKKNASISGAEVGCQGEVGVACSMAAGALTAVMGGTARQVENAAEIGMEHNLGLTCDPIGGLVQVPCIERNAMGAVKAIDASRLALRGDGKHMVSLDKVIETMRQTGEDMKVTYKETSKGGLAVNVVEC
ncbi:L-serine dehydratase, beta subunit / L-serine dehydratase, alpha subunit [hydrothermal vent metagenome]|uniref:L-serine dehydratase, beta subunit / L-serine dehydratase, alpha subunit n=1 Tax=hydrothermal vent metagenome TaxID=652676 RepID=A0A3B0RJ75_9ZZZZ